MTPYSSGERSAFERMKRHLSEGMGYFQEQATQPQTVGYNLNDSPVGLLAWIYEKLVTWTDDYRWEDDESKVPIDHFAHWVLIIYVIGSGSLDVGVYLLVFQSEARSVCAYLLRDEGRSWPSQIQPSSLRRVRLRERSRVFAQIVRALFFSLAVKYLNS